MGVIGTVADAATRVVAGLLAMLPGWVTKSAASRARKIRNDWLGNTTANSYKRGALRRGLTWGSRHPIWFTLLVACGAAVAALLTVMSIGSCVYSTDLCLHAPKLKDDFDFPAFIGTPWGAQATLVGLVYPLVISFIALMLQRRAHSTTALRLYALESAVIPAGSSSLGLLIVLTLQYFAALHASESRDVLIMPVLAFDASWFVANLGLTAYFLTRTVRFLQEDEQSLIYKRLAIDVVLRQEIAASLTQLIVASAPQREWKQPTDAGRTPGAQTILWHEESVPQVEHSVAAGHVIVDVRLRLLSWVRTSWLRRVQRSPFDKNLRRQPTLHFRLAGENLEAGRLTLCGVTNGPSLHWWEKLLVRAAYTFRQGHDIALGLSTERMMRELALECQTHYDEGRYELATEVVSEQIDLHKALICSCAFDADGVPDNAALTQSVVRWAGDHSYQWNWLSTYRDLSQRAVKLLQEDDRLFRRMANVSASLVRDLTARPPKLLEEAQIVAVHLAHELGHWWMREAQVAMTAKTSPFEGVLPAPLSHTYESALVSFLGAWDSVRVDVPTPGRTTPSEYWLNVTARAQVYATHIDHSAKVFLEAMARGDEAAAERFCDHFLKWWGIKEFELPTGDLEHDPSFDHVDFSVTNQDWPRLDASLPEHRHAVTPEFGSHVANLGLRRYWESMRLVLILLCLKNADDAPAAASRELRMVQALVQRRPLRRGADVEADALDELDAGLTRALSVRFGNPQTEQRLDAFCQRLRWAENTPEVPGWVYSWSGGVTNVDSLTHQLVQLLTALASSGRSAVPEAVRRVEALGRDLDKLESVARFCDKVRRGVLSANFNSSTPLVEALRAMFDKSKSVGSARLAVARACRKLAHVSQHERRMTLRAMTVSPAAVALYAKRLSEATFGPGTSSKLGVKPALSSGAVGITYSTEFQVEKRRFSDANIEPLSSDSARQTGERLRMHADAWALREYLKRTKTVAVPALGLERMTATLADLQAFVSGIASACVTVQSAGKVPVVLVSPGPLSGYLENFQWLHRGRTLPAGVTLRSDQSSEGKRQRYINDVPIRETSIPGGGCYVVPAADIETLNISATDLASALTATWRQGDDETVHITVAWTAGMGL